MTSLCPYCGWPDNQPFQVVSEHRTAGGLTVWTRCACGSLQARLVGPAGASVVTRGQPWGPGGKRAAGSIPLS